LAYFPILSQINPIYTSPFHLLKDHFYIIFPSKHMSSNHLLPSGSPPKLCMQLSCFPCVLHVLPISISWLYHPNNILWEVQIFKLLFMSSLSPVAYYFGLLRPKVILSTLLLDTLPTFLPQCERPRFAPYTSRGEILFLYISIFIFLDKKPEDRIFCTEW
jgi:hypothetical protein